MNKKVTIHFICDGKKIHQLSLNNVPRIRDEVRIWGDQFFTVKRVVWCYDENHFEERANVELEKER